MTCPLPITCLKNLEIAATRRVSLDSVGVWCAQGEVSCGPKAGLVLASIGKGTTAEARRRTAAYEVLERRAIFEATEDVTAAYADISAHALHPSSLCLDEDGDLSEGCLPFSDRTVVDWAWCTSLTDRRRLLVHRPVRGGRPGFFHHTTNGAALGETFVDACLRGLLELIERDALLLHWYTQDFGLFLRTDGLNVPGLEWLAERDYQCVLRDISTEFDVPVVLAIARRRAPCPSTIVGCAAALSYSAACAGAVLEIIQALESHLLHRETGNAVLALTGALALYLEGHHWEVFELAFSDRPAGSEPADPPVRILGELVILMNTFGYEAFAIERQCDCLRPTGLAVAEIVVPGLMPLTLSQTLRGRRLRCARLHDRLRLRGLEKPVTLPHPLG